MNKYFAIGTTIVLSVALALGISKIYSLGKETVYKEWSLHESNRNKTILEQQVKYEKLQREFSLHVEQSRKTLLEKENEYKDSIANLNSIYTSGLLDSEARADKYKRISENSDGQCRGLADYAGRLDRSLVEGQHLVRQLTKALERRNSHVTFIGGILIEEQKLFDNGE